MRARIDSWNQQRSRSETACNELKKVDWKNDRHVLMVATDGCGLHPAWNLLSIAFLELSLLCDFPQKPGQTASPLSPDQQIDNAQI